MTITKEEAREIATEVVQQCRKDVDDEIVKLHQADKDNAWTEDKAKKIAADAADLAVKQITEQFYMSVGKRTVAVIGAAVIAASMLISETVRKWFGLS